MSERKREGDGLFLKYFLIPTLFTAGFAILGLYAIVLAAQYERDLAAIRQGRGVKDTYVVVDARVLGGGMGVRGSGTGNLYAVLRSSSGKEINHRVLDDPKIGIKVAGYKVNGRFRVPELDGTGSWLQTWTFVLICAMPLGIDLLVWRYFEVKSRRNES